MKRTKLDNKSVKCILLGFSNESKGYKMYDPIEKKLHISRDVVFEEDKQWKWDNNTHEDESTELEWKTDNNGTENERREDDAVIDAVGGAGEVQANVNENAPVAEER